MNEDEAFIRAIVDNPGDDTPRLDYEKWLKGRDDPRGPYLRAEREWARTGKKVKALRTLGAALDPVWMYRVSRPPVGVCFSLPIMLCGLDVLPPVRDEHIRSWASGSKAPAEYLALLLNYEGYGLIAEVEVNDHRIEGFCSIDEHPHDPGGALADASGDAISWPPLTLSDLYDNLENFDENYSALTENSYLPIAYASEYGIGTCYSAVIIVRKSGSPSPILYYDNPLSNDRPTEDAPPPQECYSQLARTLPALLQEIEDCFDSDESDSDDSES